MKYSVLKVPGCPARSCGTLQPEHLHAFLAIDDAAKAMAASKFKTHCMQQRVQRCEPWYLLHRETQKHAIQSVAESTEEQSPSHFTSEDCVFWPSISQSLDQNVKKKKKTHNVPRLSLASCAPVQRALWPRVFPVCHLAERCTPGCEAPTGSSGPPCSSCSWSSCCRQTPGYLWGRLRTP